MRNLYLDNIRWITVVLVVVYHVIYMFNSIQTAGVIGPFKEVQYQDVFQYMVYPWFMLLLFVVSGMCSRFYIEKHTHKEFLKSRTTKLLVPSTIGLFVFQWIMGYYNMSIGNAFETFPKEIPGPILYLIMSVSGTGVLWYIQLLWVFSVVLILIRKIEKDRLLKFCERTNLPAFIIMTIAVWISAQILNTPVITVYRFGIYSFGFFVGYFCFSHENVMKRLAKYYIPLSMAAIILSVAFVIVYWQKPYAEAVVLKTPLCNVFAWFAVLAILSFMYNKGNFENKFTIFMNKKSWGLYVFHYLPLAMCAYYMNRYLSSFPAVVHYVFAAVSAVAGAFLLYEIISRIPVLRFCVLGINKSKKNQKGE